MSYEIDGVIATSVIIAFVLWIASTIWAVVDVIKQKKSIKWLIIALIPFVGPLYYYLSGGNVREKLERLVRKRWPVAAVIFIILLGMYVRLLDYRWVYLRNIDSYTFYRWMGEIVNNGGIMPTWDNYILAPQGSQSPPGIQPYFYLGAYGYMLASVFVNGLTLIQFLIYFPPFLASVAAIPIYFIGKMLYDRKAGILAAFYFVFDIGNLSRSLGGDPDSDAVIFLISMAAMAMTIFVYKHSEKETSFSKKFILYSILAGMVMFIWFNSWAGYWYIFWLLAGFIGLRTIFNIVQSKDTKKGLEASKFIIVSFIIYMAIAFGLTSTLFGSGIVTDAILGPLQFQSIKGEDSQFPNVYVSVAELQTSGGPKEIIERTSVLGGPAILISPFFLLLYALVYLFYSYYKKKQHIDTILLLLVWFVGPFLATIVAVRFSILFSAPLAIGSAIILSKLIRMASGEDKSFGD